MKKTTKNELIQKTLYTILLAALFVLCGIAIFQRYQPSLQSGKIAESFLLIFLLWVVGGAFCAIVIWKPALLNFSFQMKRKFPLIAWIKGAFLCVLPSFLCIFTMLSEPYKDPWIRVYLFAFSIVSVAWLINRQNGIHFSSLIASALCVSAMFAILHEFKDVSAYPFSIGWSEGNRMWDYSVLFGKRLYNYPQDQSIPAYIDIGRQSLWGAIFLLPKVNIVMMRAWNAFLFTVPYFILGLLLFKRVKGESPLVWIGIGLWSMLFLMQGPIYTPLIIAACLIAIGRKTPFLVNCLFVLCAGAYATMSRSTWAPCAAIFAVMLTFIGQNPIYAKSPRKRWFHAIGAAASGLAGAFLYLKRDLFLGVANESAVAVQVGISASEAAQEAIPPLFSQAWFSFYLSRHPFIWNRLLPNETYRQGILLGLLIAIVYLLISLILWAAKGEWKLDLWQKMLLFAAPTVFLLVGLIISSKIGGGSNLHNLDMFLICLLIIAALAWEAGWGEWLCAKIRSGNPFICLIVLAAILLPVGQSMIEVDMRRYPAKKTTEDALLKIQETIRNNQDKDILFMDQRQLLTFGYVEKIKLIPDYEKKWMMDEAMADNAAFFAPYIADLKAHRFAAIISEPLQIKFQGDGLHFSEENDLFVKRVSIPTLCYYEPVETYEGEGVQILLPREGGPLQQDGIICP